MTRMEKRWVGILATACILGLASGAHAVPSDDGKGAVQTNEVPVKFIVKDGLAQGSVYLPAACSKAMLFAVQELRDHLRKMTGADVELAWREAKPGDSGFILSVRPEGEWKGRESAQAFTITESDAPVPVVAITGNTSLAVLYGVYQYLGDLGVRWLTPGDIGANIPRLADIPIRSGSRHGAPSFASRSLALSSTEQGHFGGTENVKAAVYDYLVYLLRNRTQFGRTRFASRGAFGFNVERTGSGHAVKPMTGLTPALMEQEPERFALVTGDDFVQKRRYDGAQVCLSNEKNIQTAISNCIAFFVDLERTRDARNADLDEEVTVPLGLSDAFGLCECDSCRKIAGTEPHSKDRLVWTFWNRVARELDAKMPGRKIAVHSPYMDLTQPPDDVTIASNILVETPLVNSWEKAPENQASYPFPKTFLQQVTKTRQAGATLGCYAYLNFPWSPTPLTVLDAAEGFAKLGYRSYHIEAMQRTEYTWPIIWSLAQFTWDSSRAPREYLKDFCRDYYGTPHDQEVLGLLEEMTRNALEMERIVFGSAADTSAMLPDELITRSRERLRSAVRQTQGRQQERLRRFADAMESQFLLATTYRAYARALNSRTEADIAELKKRAVGLEDFWRKNKLAVINTTARTPADAAGLFLKTDFANLKPVARKELEGKGPQDDRWMKELFAGTPVPQEVPNLFPLPEAWKFHLDTANQGLAEGYFKADYDDRADWPLVSSWNFPTSQGYAPQVGGHFWYRVKFNAPAFPDGRKILLRIGSLDDTGEIYLNGVKVGSQPDPNNWDKSFVLDVTRQIKPGVENVLAVHGYDSAGGEGVWRPSALYTD
jgi:hypothetical protein